MGAVYRLAGGESRGGDDVVAMKNRLQSQRCRPTGPQRCGMRLDREGPSRPRLTESRRPVGPFHNLEDCVKIIIFPICRRGRRHHWRG